MILDSVNDRITLLISELKISPNAFASNIGIKTTVIYNIQKGRNKPSFDVLLKIIERFNVSADWLFTGKGKMINETISNDILSSTNDGIVNSRNSDESDFDNSLEYALKLTNSNLIYMEFHLPDILLNLKLLNAKITAEPFDKVDYDDAVKNIKSLITFLKEGISSGEVSADGLFKSLLRSDELIRQMLDGIRDLSKELLLYQQA